MVLHFNKQTSFHFSNFKFDAEIIKWYIIRDKSVKLVNDCKYHMDVQIELYFSKLFLAEKIAN